MIKRLRWKFTAFNTAVTGMILLGMTLLCLWVSESDTRTKAFETFSNNLATASAYLEGQDRVPTAWLRQMETAGQMYISIRDSGTPLYSMGLSQEHKQLTDQFQQLRERAKSEYGLDVSKGSGIGSCAFPLEDASGNRYFGGLALIMKKGALLELSILCPLEEMERGIGRQRLIVCLAELVALGLLGIFSWAFTGKMLLPIEENHRRQVQFTAAASHELRTPLAAILSAASVLEQAEPNQRERFSGIISREGQRMTRLIGDLLTLSSADNQSWEICPEAVELDMLLLGVYEVYQSMARERGLSLELKLPEQDVPSGFVDKDRIVQLLSILMDNALTYTPAPGRIWLELRLGRNKARFYVSDTGPGIPDREKQRIFERFYRGEKSRSHRSHFGLGLCIAGEIARLHQGKLWVEDRTGGGAVFILELPLGERTALTVKSGGTTRH